MAQALNRGKGLVNRGRSPKGRASNGFVISLFALAEAWHSFLGVNMPMFGEEHLLVCYSIACT